MWRSSLPLSLSPSHSFYKLLLAASFTTRGWKQKGYERRREVGAEAALPGMKAQECSVRRCGGAARFTRTSTDLESDPGVGRRRLGWERNRFCRRTWLCQPAEMRPNCSTSWIVRGWITWVLVSFYAQVKTYTRGVQNQVLMSHWKTWWTYHF